MSPELELLLRELLADPARLSTVLPEEERVLGAGLRAVVGDAKQASPTVVQAAAPAIVPPAWSGDDPITVSEAAALLRVSPRWLYRHAQTLPFARKLSRKTLRFSRAGLVRWLSTMRYDQARLAR